jgi:hypothetical protein
MSYDPTPETYVAIKRPRATKAEMVERRRTIFEAAEERERQALLAFADGWFEFEGQP